VVASLREACFVAVGVAYCKDLYLSVSATRMRSGTFNDGVDEASRENMCRRFNNCGMGIGLGLFGTVACKMCF
jgi:hypothetical protein